MSSPRTPRILEVPMEEVRRILERAEHAPLSEKDRQLVQDLAESYLYLTQLVDDRTTTIERLRKLLGRSRSEKTIDVLGEEAGDGDDAEPAAGEAGDATDVDPGDERKESEKRKGHGRNGADAYHGAERIKVPHDSLHAGDPCPACAQGKVYELATPAVIVRLRGGAPVQATVWERQRLRCNLCGKVFTAKAPEGLGERKYDATSASMIALLKYGSGLPFNRLGGLQRNVGIPLPPSTQWEIVSDVAKELDPVYGELIRQAAQGDVVHNDDTSMTILELTGRRCKQGADGSEEDSQRTGVFTSGIVSTAGGRRIALFFTGRQHAGENLADLLAQRAAELGPPIQMCDALSRNTSPAFATIVANCVVHGRRRFVDVVEAFPAECRHVLETLGEVYRNEATTREQQMSPQQRLRFHQAQSQPLMDELHGWMSEQIEQRQVEPNSGLGQAIGYMLKHWPALTLFLRTPGAPLDNNLCERALKKVILHRKNALFYKTAKGARVGDLFMSLISTCQLCGANTLEYLTELQTHIAEVARDPSLWMPWNYRDALAVASPPGRP
jgi:transposase